MKRAFRFQTVAAVVLTVMAAVQILSVTQESQTWDEALTMAAGYSALRTGDLRLIPEHPPLGKYLNALPLLILNPSLPLDHESWRKADGISFGEEFLYRNRVPAGRMLLWSRMVSVLLTVLLGCALAWWTRRHFGIASAVLALVLFAFNPNVIAHGRYATSDIVVTLFSFLACILWGEFLLNQKKRYLLLSGVSLGLALTSKFSAFFLLPVFVLLGALRIKDGLTLNRLARSFLLVVASASLTVVTIYAPEAKRLIPFGVDRSAPSLRSAVDHSTTTGKAIAWTGARLGLRAHSFLVGIGLQAAHNRIGHRAYLLGERSQHGWWYYFPVAFALKSPVALLLALPLAASVLFLRVKRPYAFQWYVLGVPIGCYLAISMTASIDIGIRHLLPVYPFLSILAGAAIAGVEWRYRRVAAVALVVLLVAESASIHPYYLAFFNVLCGGPARGPHYLVDSNIDWGQDALRLKSFLDSQGNPEICTAYFGRVDLWYYGIAHRRLPTTDDARGRSALNCLAAISVTLLYGPYGTEEQYAWLRPLTPIKKIGYSIYVFDFRKR